MDMTDRQALAFGILFILLILLLEEIAFSLSRVKIIVVVPMKLDNVIEGEAVETPSSRKP